MKRFLYFLAGATGTPAHRVIASYGIAQAFPLGCPISAQQVWGGPGGSDGIVVSCGAGDCRYLPDEQIWTKIGDIVWIGMAKDATQLPSPQDLERSVVMGKPLKLCDGREWHIPVVCTFNGETKLRRAIGLDEYGVAVLILDMYHRDLFLSAKALQYICVQGAGMQVAISKYRAFAEQVLAVNYRIGPKEIAALGLLKDDEIVLKLCHIAIDGDEICRAAEKAMALAEECRV